MATRRRHTKAEQDDHSDNGSSSRRSIWNGSISFGLLQIPVGLYSATQQNDLRFHLLDARDLQPVGYERINKSTGKSVAWNDIVKGYELHKGEMIPVEEEDFAKAYPEVTQTIDIQDFVDAKAVHPVYWETPYYLAPTKKSGKAYAVLRDALANAGKVAIATYVLRTRQHLVAVMPHEDALLLIVLRWAHELREPKALALPGKSAATAREIAMAERLIADMSSAWDPAKYKDSYRDVLMAAIEEKAKTGKLKRAKRGSRKKTAPNATDLMALLKKSLKQPANDRHEKAA